MWNQGYVKSNSDFRWTSAGRANQLLPLVNNLPAAFQWVTHFSSQHCTTSRTCCRSFLCSALSISRRPQGVWWFVCELHSKGEVIKNNSFLSSSNFLPMKTWCTLDKILFYTLHTGVLCALVNWLINGLHFKVKVSFQLTSAFTQLHFSAPSEYSKARFLSRLPSTSCLLLSIHMWEYLSKYCTVCQSSPEVGPRDSELHQR